MTHKALVDRHLARFLENLDPISGNYARMRLGLKPLGGKPRKRSGPGESRQRRQNVRNDMLIRLKNMPRYQPMTVRSFARIVANRIISYKLRFDPNAPIPAEEEAAFLHFVCANFNGKLSKKSIENILAKKIYQNFNAS